MKGFGFVANALFVACALVLLAGETKALEDPTFVVDDNTIINELKGTGGAVQPIGKSNDAYAKYFSGQSFLVNLSKDPSLPVPNVTFYHGAHTFWHIHPNTCQVLIAASGSGYYQIWGEKPHKLLPGQTATIPAGVKHWHGAAPNTSFQHIVIMKDSTTQWLEPVNETEYNALQ